MRPSRSSIEVAQRAGIAGESTSTEEVVNILLWVLQVLLAVAFLAHGVMMLNPPPDIAVQMNAAIPRWFSVFIGVSEVLAAIGLTLPGVARVMPWLVSWAAGGIMFVETIFNELAATKGTSK